MWRGAPGPTRPRARGAPGTPVPALAPGRAAVCLNFLGSCPLDSMSFHSGDSGLILPDMNG